MGPTSGKKHSSIGQALAGMTDSVQIPKVHRKAASAGKNDLVANTARSAPVKKSTEGLPTPPNSISPSLPPQTFKDLAKAANRGPPTPPAQGQVESEIDLDDAVEHAKAQVSPHRRTASRRGEETLEAVGTITPIMLAKHHLPNILLRNGPLAIRHIMGFLTTSVPGFSGIPPAKARRLVVGALEGRGSDGEVGGMSSQVLFEKVGWGRWDARQRGQPRRASTDHSRHSPPRGGLRIPAHGPRKYRTRKGETSYGSYQDSDAGYDTPLDDHSALEHEADKMSLDGTSDSSSDFERPIASSALAGDVTDEEDWASIGAAALRQGSLPGSGVISSSHRSRSRSHQRHVEAKARGRGVSSNRSAQRANVSRSAPVTKHLFMEARRQHQLQHQRSPAIIPEDAFREGDSQDREAVEALLKLSAC